ncbi:sensor histidine kinase [Gottfriedia acidiceleris]|uniref:sensor histidine kinase n=1 Tax=Gottfriedia acidiceleris TaxID=371036 RepID=UPI003D213DBA
MITNLISSLRDFRNRGGRDVFKRTQNRLTVLYSGLVMLFLIIFIIIVFAVLYVVIMNDQRRTVESLASQEAKIIENYMIQNQQGSLQGDNQEVVLAGVDQFFYYVVNPNGEIIIGQEDIPQIRSRLFGQIKDWIPKGNETRKVKIKLEHEEFEKDMRKFHDHEIHVPSNRKEISLMVSGKPLFYKGNFIGTIYVGKDISDIYHLFKFVVIILVGLTIVFSGVALYISFFMSKKAMIPIFKSFNRQREFVADASHELRTPLSVLLSSIDAMEMTIDTEKDDFSRKILFNMKDEVKRMTNLVSGLLTLARSDSDQVEIKLEKFEFRSIAEKAIVSLQPLAASKQINLNLTAPENVIARGDSEKLSQLLYILIDNGIKYTPIGGEVQLVLSDKENELCIQLTDTGIGIKPEDHARIFDRFYRSDKSRSRQIGSHGLGLAIAKWIVEIHNGTIQVNSEVGKGSTFTIRIPISNMNSKKA